MAQARAQRRGPRGWGLTADRVVVHMLGGDGEVTIEGDTVTLAGPAVHIADIQISDSGVHA